MSLFADELNENQSKIGHKYYAAEPLKGPFWWRVVDAWSVLRGKTHSVIFASAFKKLEDKRIAKDPKYVRRVVLTSEADVKKVMEIGHKEIASKTMGIQFNEFDEVRSADGEKLGRNAPCPCGGGAKYKKCHGKGS